MVDEKCKICKKKDDEAIECDICQEWVCLRCTGISKQVYELQTKDGETIDFLCQPCKKELPQIRSLLNLKNEFQKETRINKKFRDDQQQINQDLQQRLSQVEELLKDKEINDANFPRLQDLMSDRVKVNTVLEKQLKLNEVVKKQTKTLEEDKRIEEREKNLIIYGVPDDEEEENQMKSDFHTVKKMYANKVELEPTDMTQISRLGERKTNHIRPIRLTFSTSEKRLQILRNNKNLTIEREQFEMCTSTFCEDQKKHKHIYVSTDKTKQQRETEKRLRDELKARKEQGETDLIIRNYKIIVKPNQPTHARWGDLIRNGL